MGDFNIDLLKFKSHSATDGFLNTLGSNFFQPYIMQPTRITNHSATLIDNILFNSIEHFTISGNFSFLYILGSKVKLLLLLLLLL